MEKKTIAEHTEFRDDSFTKKILFKQGDNVVFMLHFLPGQSLPAHKHPGADVYLMVVEGSGEMIVDDNVVQVSKSDVVHVDGGEMFSYSNTGSEPSSLYVVLTKIPDERYAKEI
ncbi:cupin domain-containing protein [Paenibacillus sp. YPG26]|uniref:cupin domain-containing protein n=1 Tax=Paenibacillus sp. YPG26 TaxID=2878915 RepID=UPI00203AD478|nr:cupin domain-containing protein [Paenibacillus sp. YPG26]USB31694.1 cupin domain-containing protein [Paenibacillus sp. YPG26]